MKNLILFCIALFAASDSMAQNITKIVGANIVCANKGGSVFVNINKKRLWQAETATDKSGLEFIVERIDVMRCPNCYRIRATLPPMKAEGQYILYDISGNFGTNDATMVITGYDASGPSEDPPIKSNCKIKRSSAI